jgi:hypothetical protein
VKLDLKQEMKDLDGKPILHEEKPMTLGRVCVIVLQTPIDEDRGISSEKVVARWKLCLQLHGTDEADLTAEQMTEIRNRIPKVIFTLAVAAQACDLLKG